MPVKRTLREEFEEYILSDQDRFYRLAFSYVKNSDAAMDVVQESIMKALGKLDSLRKPEHMKTWFYRILVNESINHIRKNKRFSWEDWEETQLTAEDRDIPRSLDLYQAVQRLPPKLKTVVMLRFYEDRKLEEISKITKSNLNTVKSRLYKSLKLLRDYIGEEEAG